MPGLKQVLRVIFLGTVALALSPTVFARVVYYTFDRCVESALRHNDQIRSARQDLIVSEAKLDQTHPRGIPVVKYEHRLAPVPKDTEDPANSFFGGDISVFNQFKIELGSPLSTFGKIKTAQDLAQIGIEASWFKKEKTQNEIVIKMYQIYQGIVLARDLLDLAKQAQDAIESKINDLEKEQVQDQIQILKLKVALYEIERRVEEAQKKESLALSALKFQMGLEENVQIDVSDRDLKPVSFALKGEEHYIQQAREYLPEYKLVNLGIAAKEKQLKLEKLAPVPALGVGGFFDIGRAPGITGEEDETAFTNPFNFTKAGLGLQLKGELDYVKNKAQVKQIEAELVKSVYDKRAAVGGLELDLRKTYREVLEAKSLMNKAEEEKKAARQLVFLTKSNLDIGIGEKKDYLDSLQSYLVFQGRSLEAVYNYNVAVATLKQKIGTLFVQQKDDAL